LIGFGGVHPLIKVKHFAALLLQSELAANVEFDSSYEHAIKAVRHSVQQMILG
jgi:hypothetical protein